jgi:hypothetical protein
MAFETQREFNVGGQRFYLFQDEQGLYRVGNKGPKLMTPKFLMEQFGVADSEAYRTIASAGYHTADDAEAAIRAALRA